MNKPMSVTDALYHVVSSLPTEGIYAMGQLLEAAEWIHARDNNPRVASYSVVPHGQTFSVIAQDDIGMTLDDEPF